MSSALMRFANPDLRAALGAALAVVALLLAGLPARAGDAAYVVPLGFSDDGRRFAFAEYGQQDGSGFVYGAAFFLDLDADRFLRPPVRIRLEASGTPVTDGFRAVFEAARPAMDQAGIDRPARLVLAPAAAVFGDPPVQYALPPDWRGGTEMLYLSQRVVPAPHCPDPATGFTLVLSGVEVYRDVMVPKSRGCPTTYRLSRVYTPGDMQAPPFSVAVIAVERIGFEGPDTRHVAVPLPK